MIKTITLDGLMSVTIKQSAYDMARFCWIKNLSEADVFASCVNADCTENADEVRRIPAGEFGMIDTESYETLYLNGSGTVEIVTTAFLVCPFGEGKKGGGTSLSGSASYTISNAVDYPLLGLNLYGKSVQDGTPTPDAPVDIVSVGDSGSINIKSCGKNLLNYDAWKTNNVIIHGTAIFENNGVTITATQEDAYTPHLNKYFPELAKVFVMEGETITLSWEESTNKSGRVYIYPNGGEDGRVLCDNRLQKKLTYTVPSGVTFITFRFGVSSSGDTISYKNIMIERGSEATAYEPYKGTTASITSALPLCGIPVDSDGNYTDSNGQQWVCDYVDFEKGVKVQRVERFVANEFAEDYIDTVNNQMLCSAKLTNLPVKNDINTKINAISNKLEEKAPGKLYNEVGSAFCFISSGRVRVTLKGVTTTAELNATLGEVVFIYPLATQIETPLTEAELQDYRQLQTFNGITNISNDGGADMDVKYCTNKTLSEYVIPITTALQAQIDELKSAVLSLGGNI